MAASPTVGAGRRTLGECTVFSVDRVLLWDLFLMMMAISYGWRGQITDAEMVRLVESYHGNAEEGWWDRIRPHSLGWVVGRTRDGSLAGFVNVAWDGSDHAFLIDTKVRGDLQRQGIGENLVRLATEHARAAGCEWLYVDCEERLRPFYIDACGFRPTAAGLIHLTSL